MFGYKMIRARLIVAIRGMALFSAAAFCLAEGRVVQAQFVNEAVGGVWMDVDGVLRNVDPNSRLELRSLRLKALAQMPGDLNRPSKLRTISLGRLQNAIAACQKAGTPLPDEIRYLAGLQRVRYVFVMPEMHDIVLAGPADGWTINDAGDVVGRTNGQPALQLDDLLVALRTSDAARHTAISCSINPRPEGLAAFQEFNKGIRAGDDLDATMKEIERRLGSQTITVTGVPESSRFAHVLVAADYQMKRLGMHFDPSPVKGLKSYMEMISGGQPKNMMPRWWMAANYEPLAKDAEGLAWELRGQGVKCMAEEDFITTSGETHASGKANPVSQKWADAMTAKFDELSDHLPIFRQLRNCMDLAVTASLIEKENMADKADCSLALLMDAQQLPITAYNVPKQVDTKATFVKRSSGYLISASGGVLFQPWSILQNPKEDAGTSVARGEAVVAAKKATEWWWN
jgi:peroxiredoxin